MTFLRRLLTGVLACVGAVAAVRSQGAAPSTGGPSNALYDQIKGFALTGGTADLSAFVLKRDRVTMTLTGTVYFAAPVPNGPVTGAVFIGQGTLHADVPPTPVFEKDSVKRLLNADAIDSDFKTAVFRMTDDTAEVMRKGQGRTLGAATTTGVPPEAQKLATDLEPRLLHDTSVNLSARLALSVANGEAPGVFFAEFDGGRRGRFDFVFDAQTRVPMAFDIDGGEKGLIFASVVFQAGYTRPEVWMGFYAESDYGKVVPYSDAGNLIDITHYDLDIEIRQAPMMAVRSRIDAVSKASNVKAINFNLGRHLTTFRDERLNGILRVRGVRMAGQPIAVAQEDWDGGFTVFLPAPLQTGDKITLEVTSSGDYFDAVPEAFFLRSNESWIPTHGALDRATFDMTYHHLKRYMVASAGERVSETPDPDHADSTITKFKMDQPVALVAFALGTFQQAKQKSSADKGGAAVPMEFYSVSKRVAAVSDDYFMAEIDNAIRFFSQYFGKYPYPKIAGVMHPYGFGQGFASILFLYAGADGSRGDNGVSAESFIAHETSHQWWGNIVAWRSYRDQWLSEGFAEYSSFIYAGERDERSQKGRTPSQQGPGHYLLVERAREQLRQPPRTTTGVGKGKLVEIGPIILGNRLISSKSGNAYSALIYAKGGMVLRMLNYLLSNPSQPTTSAPLFTTMSAFVEKYRDGAATTEQFFAVANEAFSKSPISQKYGMRDLDWFRDQWVYQSAVPNYSLDYELQVQPDNTCIVTGTLHQDGVPDNWMMPLPLLFTMADGKVARTSVLASGPTSKVQVKLPAKPAKVELDPANWILSDKTTTKGK